MCLTLSINGNLQFVNGHHCPYMDCPEPTQECLFMGGEAVAVEAVAAPSTVVSVLVPTPHAPVRAQEVVSAAAEVPWVPLSMSVLVVVSLQEAASVEAEAPLLWQTALLEEAASAEAEALPL